MIKINPYLNFKGNCEEAFNFYKYVFGGEFPYVGKFKDMPQDPNHPMSDEDKEKIMHISLPISKETMLMGADSPEEFGQVTSIGDNIALNINAETVEEVDRIFGKLSEGATITIPLQKTFWGDYFGILIDKFGIHWMINCRMA